MTNFNVKFSETNTRFDVTFKEVNNISDGGYERGYAEGYTKGETDGYGQGRTDGYNAGYDKGNEDGYDSGYDVGYEKGYGTGHAIGYTEGEDKGYEVGRDQGYDDGYSAGYDTGYVEGYAEGYTKGVNEGEQAERDAFWGAYQQNGNRIEYSNAFKYFTEDMFKPKYDIAPDNATNMFFESNITDLKKLLETAGVVLDFSQTRYLTACFQKSKITHLPVINCTNAFTTAIANLFLQATELVYVEKMIVAETNKYSQSFQLALSLVEIRFDGTIGEDINFQWSPLSVESMKSIISCLKNFKGTDSAFTKKVTFTDNRWAALEANSSAPDGTTWREYVGNTLGWNT